ncbi:MAG: MATE family efflux transporter [bacterium]|nr:MATE family efflux transporter [bacterium]
MSDKEKTTSGVKNLLGDPKKSLFKLSLPIIVSNISHAVYNIADAVWVSGLGSSALAAVGFFFPFFFVSIGLGMGIGIGGGAAISRHIGAKDKKRAGNVAVHTFLLMFAVAFIYIIPLLFFIENIINNISAGAASGISVSYAKIMITGVFPLFFLSVGGAVLRAEGDTKRAMWAILLGTGLNIIIDPVFIYIFDFGVAGAAWASVISLTVSSLLIFNWLFLKKNTYVPLQFKGFNIDYKIINDIFSVGFPACIQHLSIAVSMFLVNLVVVSVGGSDGIAIISTGFRIIVIGSIPVFGISSAIVSLTGAAYGARNYEKLNSCYMFSIKTGLVIELFAAVLMYTFAPYIVKAFTYSSSSAHIAGDLVVLIRTLVISYPAIVFGVISSSMFQGVGKGINALIITVLRTIIIAVPVVIIFAIVFGMGLPGVWWGMVMANSIVAVVSFTWAKIHIRNLKTVFS